MIKLSNIFAMGSVAAVGLTGFGQMAVANDSVTANVSLLSHYVFRGQDLSNNGPAVQGGFDYTHESGAYAGIWASSASLGADDDGVNSTEVDLYLGYSTEIQEYGVGVDFGYLRYDYPHTDSEDDELYVIVSYNDLSFGLWLELDTDTDDAAPYTDPVTTLTDTFDEVSGGNSGTLAYFNVGYDYSLPADFMLSAALGYQTYDVDKVADETTGAPVDFDEVLDWMLGVSKEVAGVELGLTYTDSDIDSDFISGSSSNFTISLSKSL